MKFREKLNIFYFEHEKFFQILIFAMVLRIFTFPVVLVMDSRSWVEMSTFLVELKNPYTLENDFYNKYPPLFYYLLTTYGILSDFSYIGPKLMVFSFEFLNIITIYKIGLKLKGKVLAKNVSMLYAFNPLIITQVFHDVNEFVTLFFTLLAIYFIITERYMLSAISLAFGISFKMYPIFFLIPITLYFYKNSQKIQFKIKRIIIYYLVVFFTILLICIPFLILSPQEFIENFFIHTSRRNRGDSMTERIPQLLIMYEEAFKIFGISFSFQFIVQFCVVLLIFCSYLFLKRDFNIYDLFFVCAILALVLPLINYQIQLKYTNLIGFPFLLFLIHKNLRKHSENETYFLYFMNFIPIILFFMFYIILFPPFGNLLSTSNLIEKGMFFGGILLICLPIFIINEYRRHENRNYKIPILNMLPFIAHNIISNYWGDLIAIGIIFLTILYICRKYRNN